MVETLLTSTVNGGIVIIQQPRAVEGGIKLLKNLSAEMARYGVSTNDIGMIIGKSERTARDKIKGQYQFSISESILIRDKLFPGLALEYLFANSNEAG